MKNLKTFPLAQRPSAQELHLLGAYFANGFFFGKRPTRPGYYVVAAKTGVYRKPHKGEWFLSGAIPEAYKAPNNLDTDYWIMRLVLVRRELIVVDHVINILK